MERHLICNLELCNVLSKNVNCAILKNDRDRYIIIFESKIIEISMKFENCFMKDANFEKCNFCWLKKILQMKNHWSISLNLKSRIILLFRKMSITKKCDKKWKFWNFQQKIPIYGPLLKSRIYITFT